MKSFSDLYQEIYQQSESNLSTIKKQKRTKHIILFGVIVISFLLWRNMPVLFSMLIVIAAIWLFVSFIKQRAIYISYYKEEVIKNL